MKKTLFILCFFLLTSCSIGELEIDDNRSKAVYEEKSK